MNKKEQEFINQMKKESEAVNVPESLEPREIEKLLKSRPKKFVWKKAYTAAAAACCILVCGLAFGMTKDGGYSGGREGAAAGGTEADPLRSSGFETAENYEDVYEYLQARMEEMNGRNYDSGEVMITEDSASDMPAGGAAAPQRIASEAKTMDAAVPETASADYSETNVRQEGVDEADVVKTDGRYLYTLRDNGRAVVVVDTKDGLKEAAEVKLEDTYSIREFYVNSGKLVLTGEIYREEKTKGGWYMSSANTFAVTYDVSDPVKPKKLGEVTQSGYYTSSRMTEGHLYLFSQYTVDTASGIEPKMSR